MNVLITGAASGFGRLTALSLAKRGYTVFATMRGQSGPRAEAAGSLTEEAEKLSGSIFVYDLDVTSDESVNDAVSDILSNHEHIDVVINNAGIFGMGFLEVFGLEQLQKLVDVNVYGAVRVNNAVLPSMRKRASGLLIQITSVVTGYTLPFCAAYAASKAMAERIAEGYRYDLSSFGIDSVILQPGAYPTEIVNKVIEPSHPELMQEYAAVAPVTEKFSENYSRFAYGDDPPNPQFVADKLVRLIETPAGSRPLRTVADARIGGIAETVNACLADTQKKVLHDLDISELAQVRR